LQRAAQEKACALAAAGLGVSATQIHGLANALGAGPQRRTPAQRRLALARYLAWRASRAKDTGGWSRLAHLLTQEFTQLETRCRSEVKKVRTTDTGDWETHAAALAEAGAQLEIQVLETFIHALARCATGAEV
jgi:hypothetical protein